MNFLLYPFFYAIAYVVLTIVGYCFFRKKKSIGCILALVYAVSAFSSVYYYNTGWYSGLKLLVEPYIYLFFVTTVTIVPFFFANNLETYPVDANKKQDALIYGISIFFAVCSFWWFLEDLKIMAVYGIADINFVANYDGTDYTGERISFLGRKFKFFAMHLKEIGTFCLFYQLTRLKKRKKLILLLVLGSLASCLDSFMGGHRFVIVLTIINYSVYYLLFRNLLSNSVREKIKKIAIVFLVIVVLCLSAVTLARFASGKSDLDLMTWVTLYSGEGPLRFNLQAWNMPIHTEGDNTFTVIKDLLGFDAPNTFEERTIKWGGKHGLWYMVYYTAIGDVFFDFGIVGTALFSIMLALISFYLINNYRGNAGDLLILGLILKYIMFGFMYNPYLSYDSQIELIIAFGIGMIIRNMGRKRVHL